MNILGHDQEWALGVPMKSIGAPCICKETWSNNRLVALILYITTFHMFVLCRMIKFSEGDVIYLVD